jgi:hypothetical protein
MTWIPSARRVRRTCRTGHLRSEKLIMTSNRPIEEWGKLLGDVPSASAILDRFLHHAQTIAITGRSYRLKDQAAVAGKEQKNKTKSNEPLAAGSAS